LYLFDNIPNTTDGITPPPPETGYLQQNAGEAGARFDSMRAAEDPVLSLLALLVHTYKY
jgi:hypothetical protein